MSLLTRIAAVFSSPLATAFGRKRLFVLARMTAMSIILCSAVAKADTLETFNLTGTFGPSEPLTGIITFDTTTGLATFGDFSATVNGTTYVFDSAPIQDPYYGEGFTSLAFYDASAGININLPGTSFVGYSGSSLCSLSSPCGDYRTYINVTNPVTIVESGSLTSAITPEPSSLILMTSGLLAGAGFVRRRFV
jgi:hypothetical protein